MAYGRASGDCRVMEYGVPSAAVHKGLLQGAKAAIEEMRRRVQLWNRLVDIDQQYRQARSELLGPAPTGEDGKRLKRQLTAEQKDALARLDDVRREAANQACRESGCYWCNYSDVKVAWEVARRKPDSLRHHSWRGDGKVTTQLMRGLPVPQAFGQHGFLRLSFPHPDTYPEDVIVQMRIGSDEQRRPLWLTLPIRMHRPLPEDCLVKSVSALRERLANRSRWRVVFVLERPAGASGTWARFGEAERRGSIAIDVGWRRLPHGLRVATWHDDAGQTGELVLPERYLEQRRKVEDLQSIRQRSLNELLAALRAWLAANPDRPQWLREATAHIASWKHQRTPARLLRLWQERRFRGDEGIVALLETWAKDDLHLWQWQDNLRDQAIRWRREMYRCWAADIVRRYERVVLEDFDLARVARVKGEGINNELVARARYYRTIAGVYQCREALANACQREGVEIVRQPAVNTTAECAVCGSLESWDHRELYHVCSQCGTRWDQDYNAAAVLTKRDLAAAGSAAT